MQREIKNLEEMRVFAEEFLQNVILTDVRRPSGASLVGLSGNLGAGKTAFTKCVASVLGIKDTITSPTFILEKIYEIPKGGILGDKFEKLIHIDAYRLNGASEIKALDWETIISDKKNLILIEWPEQVEGAMPTDALKIYFEYVDEGVRRVRVL